MDIRPSWSRVWTRGQAEHQLRHGCFIWRGPGWYFEADSTMLVLPVTRPIETLFHTASSELELFHFYVWDGDLSKEVGALFGAISTAPTRSDVRT